MQCSATYQGKPKKGDVTIRFCTREHGHEGDHRGDRVQWTRKGVKVKISLPPDVK